MTIPTTARWRDLQLTPRLLAGRCANGAEGGKGSRFHLTTDSPYGTGTALCGARPGRRSAGWSNATADAPTCPRCIAKAANGGAQ